MKVTKTGKIGEIYGITAPIVEIEGGYLRDGDLVTVDGEQYYYFDCDGEFEYLSRTAVSLNAGDNVVETRTAPASIGGMAYNGRGQPKLVVVGGDYDYLVRQKSL